MIRWLRWPLILPVAAGVNLVAGLLAEFLSRIFDSAPVRGSVAAFMSSPAALGGSAQSQVDLVWPFLVTAAFGIAQPYSVIVTGALVAPSARTPVAVVLAILYLGANAVIFGSYSSIGHSALTLLALGLTVVGAGLAIRWVHENATA